MDWARKTCRFACRSIIAHNYQTQRVIHGSIVGFHRCSAIVSFVSVPVVVYLDEVKYITMQFLFQSSVGRKGQQSRYRSDVILYCTLVLTVQVAATKTSRLSISAPARSFYRTFIPHPITVCNIPLIASTRNITRAIIKHSMVVSCVQYEAPSTAAEPALLSPTAV